MLEIPPNAIDGDADRLGFTAVEVRLLAPDHPFLKAGTWRVFAAAGTGAATGRLVASVDPRQQAAGGPVGCLGFLRLGDARRMGTTTGASARDVLEAGVDWLRSRGAVAVRCPVQLSTWYGHRAITSGFPGRAGAAPAFPLEPVTEPELPDLLAAAGFRVAHRAVSCLEDSAAVVAGTAAAIRRARAAGIRDRPIRLADLDDELRLIHRLAEATFRGTWGLSAITFDEFASIYRPLDGQADPELVRILEAADGTPIGFALGLPIEQARRDGGSSSDAPGESFVLKSIGVMAEARRRVPGLGAALVGLVHRRGLERGASSGIHALMTTGSNAHRLSLHWGTEFRSYATYELATG